MLRKFKLLSMTALIAVMTVVTVKADKEQDYNKNYNNSPEQIIKIDRYLDVEVWTNHADNEFYEGDNIVLSFRANRDAFVAIYTVDSRGRVNLLFPSSRNASNFIEGGETYRLPDHQDDFDFVVSGPEGVETIQIIASKERFPIPDWYPTSGIIDDAEDRHEFMDYINSRYFVRYDGQRFAFDRASIYINEWEDDYYRPVYDPYYPSWTTTGNMYIDYPYGGSVYVNGIYWGIAPLYIPSIYVGWHTFSIYDSYGYGWESDIHVSRYNTVVLNRNTIHTSSNVRSKYKAVRTAGYRNPVTNGYPKYKTTKVLSTKNRDSNSNKVVTTKKRYVRGTTEVVKTKRGYETTGQKTYSTNKRSGSKTTTAYERNNKRSSGKSTTGKVDRKRSSKSSTGSRGSYKRSSGKTSSSGKSSSRKTATYKKKSSKKQSSKSSKVGKRSGSKKSSYKKSSKAGKQSKRSGKSSSGSKSGSYKKSGGSGKSSKSSGSARSRGSSGKSRSSGSSSRGSSGKSSGSRGGKSKR